MGVLLQILKIIFEVQMKMSSEKITRKKKVFQLIRHFFFPFFFLGPFLLSNLITFLFFIHFKQSKMLQECHLKFYKSSLNSNSNRTTYKEFCWCLGTTLCTFGGFVFEFLTPSTLRGHNFFNSISFFMSFSAPNANRWGSSFV